MNENSEENLKNEKEKESGVSTGFFNSSPFYVRIAVYDNFTSIPRIIDLTHDNVADFITSTTEKIYKVSHEQGGKIPYMIIREIVENLIHADFSEVIITIINNGNQIIISDQGPGITDKEKAFLPGFTSATQEMKKYIRGVGSGLPVAKESISFSGGSINIKDNLKKGTVVILNIETDKNNIPDFNELNTLKEDISLKAARPAKDSFNENKQAGAYDIPFDLSSIKLTIRQIKIMYIILELEEAGPSTISKELGFSLSTSFRELAFLEKEGLLKTFTSGKKRISKKGFKYLEYYSNSF